MNQTYADLIWDAAIYSGVSPYHLASRIKQEMGAFISKPSISGTVEGYEGIYNFYNIGATSSTANLGNVKNGLDFAKNGRGLTEKEKANLFIPWNTPERAIKGGAVFIGKNYISVGQNTLYLQKFSVNNNYPSNLYWHQYMTNCLAPYNEAYSIYKAYLNNEMLNTPIGFLIPVFENMPEVMAQSPSISSADFETDNTKMYANVTTTLNIRCGPTTEYEILTSIKKDTVVTRIEKGKNGWDKVMLENGLIGYAFGTYLKEVQEQPENSIINFSSKLRINEKNISNLPYNNLTVSNIKKLIQTNLQTTFKNANNEILTDENLIGTGSTILFTNANNEVIDKYEFILYGDLNGDSLINSLDVLILQKHILEIKLLEGVYLKAANLSKQGANPSALDVLKIQKHILEISFIEQ